MTTNLVFPFALIIVVGLFSTYPISSSDFHNNTITSSSNIEKIDSWNLILQDTFPKNSNSTSRSNSKETYRTNSDGKKIHLVVENGVIKKLKINGKKINKNDFDEYTDLIKELRASNQPPTPPIPPSLSYEDTMDAHNKAMSAHERTMESHQKNIETHHKQIEAHGKAAKKNNQISEAFTNQLWRDGLISDKGNFSFSLSLKKFKVNKEIQNKSIREKYIRLYEQYSDTAMNTNSTYTVSHGSF